MFKLKKNFLLKDLPKFDDDKKVAFSLTFHSSFIPQITDHLYLDRYELDYLESESESEKINKFYMEDFGVEFIF